MAVAGPIGFVGLVAPHVVRLLAGPAHGRLIPLAALVGAVLVLAADVVGRLVVRPAELAVGIVLGVVLGVVLGIVGRRSSSPPSGAGQHHAVSARSPGVAGSTLTSPGS